MTELDKERQKLIKEEKRRRTERNTGKTTRTADRLIQDFFNNGIAYIYEKRDDSDGAKRNLLDLIIIRISTEHPSTKLHYEWGSFGGIRCYKLEMHDL